MLGSEVDLESVLTRITRAGNQTMNPANFAKSKVVVANRIERNGREALKNFLRSRALNCQLRVSWPSVLDLRIEFVIRFDVFEVVILIASVDAQQIVRVRDFMNQQVIHKSA